MHKAVKLPKIDSAKGVEPVTQSSQSTELLLANKEMTEVQHKLDNKKEEFNERMVSHVPMPAACACTALCSWQATLTVARLSRPSARKRRRSFP